MHPSAGFCVLKFKKIVTHFLAVIAAVSPQSLTAVLELPESSRTADIS